MFLLHNIIITYYYYYLIPCYYTESVQWAGSQKPWVLSHTKLVRTCTCTHFRDGFFREATSKIFQEVICESQ